MTRLDRQATEYDVIIIINLLTTLLNQTPSMTTLTTKTNRTTDAYCQIYTTVQWNAI